MNPQTVQTGIITTVGDSVDGLHQYDYSDPSLIPPALDVMLDQLTYGATFDEGSCDAVFLLRIIVGAVAVKGNQEQLYRYIATTGSLSIPAALAADPTLDGTVASSYLLPTRRIGATGLADGGTKYWEAQLPLAVFSLE